MTANPNMFKSMSACDAIKLSKRSFLPQKQPCVASRRKPNPRPPSFHILIIVVVGNMNQYNSLYNNIYIIYILIKEKGENSLDWGETRRNVDYQTKNDDFVSYKLLLCVVCRHGFGRVWISQFFYLEIEVERLTMIV